MLNCVTLVGRLTKDPDLKYTQNGTPVANFTLAVQRDYKNDQGEYEADFIQCVAWRGPAEIIADLLKKGSFISIAGKIETRNYEGQDGKRVYVTEINVQNFHFLEKRESSLPPANSTQQNTTSRYQSTRR
jgi:single-strand DNA-binding protein